MGKLIKIIGGKIQLRQTHHTFAVVKSSGFTLSLKKDIMLMHWVIGCAEHGINKDLLLAVRHSLRILNAMACSWTGLCAVGEGEIDANGWFLTDGEEMCGHDFYQGVDHVGVPKCNTVAADLTRTESNKFIVLVTTSYKIRQAHYDALDAMNIMGAGSALNQLVFPYHDMNSKIAPEFDKSKMQKMLYTGKESTYTAWPHTEEKQESARQKLNECVASASPAATCPCCNYWGPVTMLEARCRGMCPLTKKQETRALFRRNRPYKRRRSRRSI